MEVIEICPMVAGSLIAEIGPWGQRCTFFGGEFITPSLSPDLGGLRFQMVNSYVGDSRPAIIGGGFLTRGGAGGRSAGPVFIPYSGSPNETDLYIR